MTVPLLRVDDLHVYCPDHAVGTAVHGLQLTVCHGELHAITGTERSVTSALGAILMGSDRYEVARGTIEFRGDDVTDWPVDERAKAGMFLAFDDPQEIPGVSMIQVLHQALSARSGSDVSISELRVATTEWMQRLDMNPDHLDRQGYEILHMAMLRPGLAIVDATDPDLDDDALRSIARGIGEVRSDQPDMGIVVVTEHRRLLDDLDPDVVHVLVDGRIVTSGNIDLAGASVS